MIYLITCLAETISLPSLGVTLNRGDSFECPKHLYASNKELKSLVGSGDLSAQPRMPVVQDSQKKGLVARVGAPKTPIQAPQQSVVHKTEVHHHENSVDLDSLASKLLEKLSGVLSPEMIAQAVASQIPQQQVVVQPSQQTQATQVQQTAIAPSEELTFIPSKIISSDVKSSATSTVSESSGQDAELGDALAALRAMRKTKK